MAAAPGVPGAGVSSLLSLVSLLSLSLAELSSPASGCGVSGASCVTTGRSSLARRRKAGLICCWFGSLVAPPQSRVDLLLVRIVGGAHHRAFADEGIRVGLLLL